MFLCSVNREGSYQGETKMYCAASTSSLKGMKKKKKTDDDQRIINLKKERYVFYAQSSVTGHIRAKEKKECFTRGGSQFFGSKNVFRK